MLQSGPMLVIEGEVNGHFSHNSENYQARSGVGVDANGQVVFAASANAVSFYNFASVFLLFGSEHALYLDGGAISYIYAHDVGEVNLTQSQSAYYVGVVSKKY